MSALEDLDFDAWDIKSPSEDWEDGLHTDQHGRVWKLSELKTTHLENIIRYFEGEDTSALEKELAKRKK